MVIQRDRGKDGDIDHVLELIVYHGSQFWVQGMDAFYYQNRILLHLQFLTLIDTLTGSKIESRQINFLPGQQILQLTVKIRKIKGIERLEIIIAGFIFRRIFPVQKIVVERYTYRVDQVCDQLDFQAFAESGFPGRRRT